MTDTARGKRRVLELKADLRALLAFDQARAALPFDMTHGRRARAIARLDDELRAARRELELEALVAGDRALDRDAIAALEPDRLELEAALWRDARRRLQRPDVSDAVIDALNGAARWLDIPPERRPIELREAQATRRTGGSRGSRRRLEVLSRRVEDLTR